MKTRQQYAALPYMQIGKQIEVLLITRRRSGRWIIPKGWPETALSGRELAALEAYEEAGLKGRIGKKSVGRFSYIKQLDDGSKLKCEVTVYPLKVNAQYLDWPEKGQRQLRWVKQKKANELIEELDLATLIQDFTPAQKSKRPKLKITSKKTKKNRAKIKATSKNNRKKKNKNKSQLRRSLRASF